MPATTPVDHGWAWMVMGANIIMNYLLGLLLYTTGIIHVAMLDEFQNDVTSTSWASGIIIGIGMLASPVSTLVVQKFGCRTSVITGGLLVFTGCVVSTFAKSIWHIFFSYGLVAGTGCALAVQPTFLTVVFYFSKYRGLVSGVTQGSVAIGTLTGPLMFQNLLDSYGLSGMFLLLGAIQLHIVPMGALFRPTEHEGKQLKEKRKAERANEHEDPSLLGLDCQNSVDTGTAERRKTDPKPEPTNHNRPRDYINQLLHELRPLANNWAYIIHVTGVLFFMMAQSGVNLHLPEYVRTLGTSATDTATLFVGYGVLGLVSRLLSGVLTTGDRLSPLTVCTAIFALGGLSTALFPLYSATYVGQHVFTALFGLATGGYYTLINLLAVELVGIDTTAVALGLEGVFQGIGFIVGPPLAGLIVDNGGTYGHSFLFLGLCLCVATVCNVTAKTILWRRSKTSACLTVSTH